MIGRGAIVSGGFGRGRIARGGRRPPPPKDRSSGVSSVKVGSMEVGSVMVEGDWASAIRSAKSPGIQRQSLRLLALANGKVQEGACFTSVDHEDVGRSMEASTKVCSVVLAPKEGGSLVSIGLVDKIDKFHCMASVGSTSLHGNVHSLEIEDCARCVSMELVGGGNSQILSPKDVPAVEGEVSRNLLVEGGGVCSLKGRLINEPVAERHVEAVTLLEASRLNSNSSSLGVNVSPLIPIGGSMAILIFSKEDAKR